MVLWTDPLKDLLLDCYNEVHASRFFTDGEGGLKKGAWKRVEYLFNKKAPNSPMTAKQLENQFTLLKRKFRETSRLANDSGTGGSDGNISLTDEKWDYEIAKNLELQDLKESGFSQYNTMKELPMKPFATGKNVTEEIDVSNDQEDDLDEECNDFTVNQPMESLSSLPMVSNGPSRSSSTAPTTPISTSSSKIIANASSGDSLVRKRKHSNTPSDGEILNKMANTLTRYVEQQVTPAAVQVDEVKVAIQYIEDNLMTNSNWDTYFFVDACFVISDHTKAKVFNCIKQQDNKVEFLNKFINKKDTDSC